ncbi:hypothetical protein QT381_06485 [Galbitalea sp. SE-J8]|uniref:DoxX family protein n=1 Tax=Galbitalea sp. SE-J8 TaxID=3054952 RepID=UPI00259CC9AA|nr:hypothetical protein [Galbitalea sp. SE-J8]MDM4762650.1 hypothetical protein [Galbitalea sp. SE-J8]
MPLLDEAPPTSVARTLGRLAAGGVLVLAGITHLTVARRAFRAQVPDWVPIDPDATVLLSGVAEIALGSALVGLPTRRVPVGWAAAAFFTAIFPGNVSQFVHGRDAFGLDTDAKRLARLPLQAVLVAGVLWATGAWRDRPRRSR